jgi:hypothetical protein
VKTAQQLVMINTTNNQTQKQTNPKKQQPHKNQEVVVHGKATHNN